MYSSKGGRPAAFAMARTLLIAACFAAHPTSAMELPSFVATCETKNSRSMYSTHLFGPVRGFKWTDRPALTKFRISYRSGEDHAINLSSGHPLPVIARFRSGAVFVDKASDERSVDVRTFVVNVEKQEIVTAQLRANSDTRSFGDNGGSTGGNLVELDCRFTR